MARKRADIVVFKPGGPRKQDTVAILVEAKREDVSPKNKSEGVEQLKSYMSACSSCLFGLWVGAEKLAYEKSNEGEIEDTTDIPRFGETQPQPPKFHELKPATDLKASFRRCHNYIYANQGIQKAEAFHEVQKLIFCKVLDEKEVVDDLRFFVLGEERKSIAGQRRLRDERITFLFEEVKSRYPYIFDPDERIKLNFKVLAYVVSELQRYSFSTRKPTSRGRHTRNWSGRIFAATGGNSSRPGTSATWLSVWCCRCIPTRTSNLSRFSIAAAVQAAFSCRS